MQMVWRAKAVSVRGETWTPNEVTANALWLTKALIALLPGYCASKIGNCEGNGANEPPLTVLLKNCRVSWNAAKKNALFFLIGPPKVPPKTLLMNLSFAERPGSLRSRLVIASMAELRMNSKPLP